MPRDDEDDRPKKRRRPADEDDDDRPSSRRRPRDEDEDDERPSSARRRARARDEDDYDDRPRKKKKKKKPQQSVLGAVALVLGGLGLGTSFACGAIGLVPALIGLGLGVIGFFIAQKSDGRQSPILPISGSAVSLVATVVSVIFLISFIKHVKEVQKDFNEGMEQAAKDEADRKKELSKAAGEVKAAAGAATRLTAEQFFQAYVDDPDRADRSYKNKVLELTGVVRAVHIEAGAYGVVLKGGADEGALVECHFPEEPAVRVALSRLAPGQRVTIRGKCLGGDAEIEGCVLVK